MRRGPTRLRALLGAAALLLAAAVAAHAARDTEPGADRTRADLIDATREYRASLERVLAFRTHDVERATALVEQRRVLYTRGIVSRREVEDAERALDGARAKREETRQEMAGADRALAEALAGPALAAAEDRATGSAAWSLADTPRLDRFFRERFGHPLPVSAYGQSPAHDRLGLDHHQALDVAIHPDSREGAALLGFLRSSGIPFLAFRGPVAGGATGAHIHVGAPSPRVDASSSPRTSR